MKTIFTGFSPNTRKKDTLRALSFLLLPWKWLSWKSGTNVTQAENMLSAYLGDTSIIIYDSGRTALYQGLRALGVGEGDEVLVQAFTCIVVINAIRWTGATPVYIDIDADTLNMDPNSARERVTDRTKAMIMQHTFGLPADIDALLGIAKEHSLKTIEDCAHSLGARYKGQLTGTFADIGMYSFGGEKNISCVRGGALTTSSGIYEKVLRESQSTLPKMSTFTIFQHLFHVVVFPFGKKFYHLGFGKAFLKVMKEFHLINKIITQKEKRGLQEGLHSSTMPNVLAGLLVQQIPQIDSFNEHRATIAKIYTSTLPSTLPVQHDQEGRVHLRYPVFRKDSSSMRAHAKSNGILLGDWYSTIVGPADIVQTATGYIPGSCPVAEKKSAEVVNLPTNIHISNADAQKIVMKITE